MRRFGRFLLIMSLAGSVPSGTRQAESQTCYWCYYHEGLNVWSCEETGSSSWGYMTCQVIPGGCNLGVWCGFTLAHSRSQLLGMLPEGTVFGGRRVPCLAKFAATWAALEARPATRAS